MVADACDATVVKATVSGTPVKRLNTGSGMRAGCFWIVSERRQTPFPK